METLGAETWKNPFLVVWDLFPLYNLFPSEWVLFVFSTQQLYSTKKKKREFKSSRLRLHSGVHPQWEPGSPAGAGGIPLPPPTHKRALSEGNEKGRKGQDAKNGTEEKSPARCLGIKHQGGLGSWNGSAVRMEGGFWSNEESGEPPGICRAPDNTELHGVRHRHRQDGNVWVFPWSPVGKSSLGWGCRAAPGQLSCRVLPLPAPPIPPSLPLPRCSSSITHTQSKERERWSQVSGD